MTGTALFKRLTNGRLKRVWQQDRLTPLHCEPVLRTICDLVAKHGTNFTYHLEDGIPASPDELIRIIALEMHRIGATDAINLAIEDLVRGEFIQVSAAGAVTLNLQQSAADRATQPLIHGERDNRAVNAAWNGDLTVGAKAKAEAALTGQSYDQLLAEKRDRKVAFAASLIGAHDPTAETEISWKRRALVEMDKLKGTKSAPAVPGQGSLVMGVPASQEPGEALTCAQLAAYRRSSFKVATVDGMSVPSPAVGSNLGSNLGSTTTQTGTQLGSTRVQFGLDLGSPPRAQLASQLESSIEDLKLASSSDSLLEGAERAGAAETQAPNPTQQPNPDPEPRMVEASADAEVLFEPLSSKDEDEQFQINIDSVTQQIRTMISPCSEPVAECSDWVGKWLILEGMSINLCLETARTKVERNARRVEAKRREGKHENPIGSFSYFDVAMTEAAARAKKRPGFVPTSSSAPPRKPAAQSFTRPVAEPLPQLPPDLRDKNLHPADHMRIHRFLELYEADKEKARERLASFKANRRDLWWRLYEARPEFAALTEPERKTA